MKQLLDQRPSVWMSQGGRPASAAVVAAPIYPEAVRYIELCWNTETLKESAKG